MADKILEEELKERLHTRRLDKLAASMSGACISKGHCYTIDDEKKIFVKTNGSLNARLMFEGELEALKHIAATKTIRVPKPVTVMHNYDGKSSSALAMEFLDIVPLSGELAKSLGQNLADLHDYNNKLMRYNVRASRWVGKQIPSDKPTLAASTNKKANEEDEDDKPRCSDEEQKEEEEIQFARHSMRVRPDDIRPEVEKKPGNSESPIITERFVPQPNTEQIDEFGFHVATSCGSIAQSNAWSRDWVTFYARRRLDHTIRMVLSDHADRDLNEQWSHLQLKISNFFSDFEYKGSGEGEIVPALLHGDLWSGNVAQMADNSMGVIYDPAAFYGHSEYEFGIARMFGAIPPQLERAYFEQLPRRKLFEQRNKLYQLFHSLNHWNHFGSGYRLSSINLMKNLNAVRL